MANHGFTTVGTSIKQAVYRAVYTHTNAKVQSNGLMLRSAYLGTGGSGGGLRYLNEEQTKGAMQMNDASLDRPWGLWVKEVESDALYSNQTKSDLKFY